MTKFSIREVVEMAIQTEKLGYEFYIGMSKKFYENSKLKKLFELLAAHESKHGKSFSELMDEIKDEEPEGWDEVTLYLRALVDSEFFLGKDKCLPSLEHVKTVKEAINYALCFERDLALLLHIKRRDNAKGTY